MDTQPELLHSEATLYKHFSFREPARPHAKKASSLSHTHRVKQIITVALVKTYHLQHSHTPNLILSLIWLANHRRHKIRYLHTSQPAFFKS